jgi:hypothetical protein
MRFAGNRIFLALASVVIAANARTKRGKHEMFFKCYGSSSIASQFACGIGPSAIVASWTAGLARFMGERSQNLFY